MLSFIQLYTEFLAENYFEVLGKKEPDFKEEKIFVSG